MVICFSGTGNSLAVAHGIADRLSLPLIEISGALLTTPSAADPLRCGGNTIVWVFPVYSWGVPPVMVNFIRNIEIEGAGSANHHLVITCGDDAGMTASQWRRLMKGRRWKTASATSVIMPNTYVLMKGFDTDPESLEHSKLESAPERVDLAAGRIRSGATGDLVTRGKFPHFKSRIIYPWFKRYAMSPKPFHATNACIGCGKCAASCPCLNIKMEDGHPRWGNICALCLRCYHTCPVHAVAYGKATAGKGQYLCPDQSR